MTWDLRDFVRESNMIEGIIREPSEDEILAHEQFLSLGAITIKDLEDFVSYVAPGAKLRREVGMDVRVGVHVPVRGSKLVVMILQELLNDVNKITANPWSVHLAYEQLHPFMDGNGRSGRVLWLWMMGGSAPKGFLHQFYYQTLDAQD